MMKIRTIEQPDFDNCSVLFANVFSSDPWSEEWTQQLAFDRLSHFYESNGFLGVVAIEHEVAGFALGNIEPFCFGSIFYLREMCVQKGVQRKGIGFKIIDVLEASLSP